MTRNADIVWNGGLKDGKGTITTQSKALDKLPYSFETRFEGTGGVSPEELIASAHAACFSMAVASGLGEKAITPQAIHTTSTVTMQDLKLTKSALVCTIVAPGADESTVKAVAQDAKENCPISKALSSLEITLDLTVQV